MMTTTVMLVDDEPRILEALKRTLQRKNYDVHCALGAAVALELLETAPVDVVVSDENMPGMRGIEFLARVASRWPTTVRIMLTGHSDLEMVLRAINEGQVQQFCLKPCDGHSLDLAISRARNQAELEMASWQLLKVARNQAKILEDIERLHPGATRVEKDDQGVIVMNDVESGTVDDLLRELNVELGKTDSVPARATDG